MQQQQQRTFKFHHGTSVRNAKNIYQNGFQKSTTGSLGEGVYVGRKNKAKVYANGAIVDVLITVKNPKFQRTNKRWNDDDWRKQGHDAVRVDYTMDSGQMEWCIKDPSQIQVLRWYEVEQTYACQLI